MKNPIAFLREVRQELVKITWPSRKETLMASMTVIFISVLVAIFFLLLDQLFKFGLGFIIS
jgi:preprotein translocase subunit SecE